MKKEMSDGDMREYKWRKARKRQNRIRLAMVMLCTLVVLVVIMYCGTALYLKITEEKDGDAVEALGGTVVYSQEELDMRVAQAVSEAEARALEAESNAESRIQEAVRTAQEQGQEEVLDNIRTSISDGQTMLEALRPLYPEELLVASGGQYHFVPINRGLKQSQLVQENVNLLESGEIQYMSGEEVVSHKGIDVSRHQGNIDWTQVAQDGVEFAFIRVAYRGYGTGKLEEDSHFDQNVQGAQAAGIKTGVYFYSQAITEEEILEEANLVLQKVAPYQLECPIVFDVELVSGANGRMNNITPEERTALTLLFCQTIEAAGYKPMIYHNTEMGALKIDVAALEDYDKWFASYSETLYYPYEYKVWQYTSHGKVAGISSEVDLNICIEPVWEE
ncbi:MAG: glycoside hydrolase family 25 protein [Eubacterium sp.]|nr:glycoside hydrolase family 25 protein [Eubacterium sp.]MCM1065513.1 glycoside hydrolase family 25 protein [Eubacterium sp.]MCM1302506.1 glycoside hydrolase family 25 protein [Butyrivibrio sp.]MCM1344411.1 glycoside hydrolase family 25 protein [Muribaculaceae bacterium]MCM1411677.1 glycoside hydrolase family 25 protein [Lachnospiraceae bacterium]